MAQVRVGIGCFLFNSHFHTITGVRKGSIGAGTIALAGGHLELGEEPEACAAREVLEETGIFIREGDVKFITAVNSIFEADQKQYITLFYGCRVPDDVKPEVLEPEKCEAWEWTSLETLTHLAHDPASNLFLPIRNLFHQRQGLDYPSYFK
ncbi:hypothetical protein JCM10207_004035 [Rhodosporidiobolus poonsookiae]